MILIKNHVLIQLLDHLITDRQNQTEIQFVFALKILLLFTNQKLLDKKMNQILVNMKIFLPVTQMYLIQLQEEIKEVIQYAFVEILSYQFIKLSVEEDQLLNVLALLDKYLKQMLDNVYQVDVMNHVFVITIKIFVQVVILVEYVENLIWLNQQEKIIVYVKLLNIV